MEFNEKLQQLRKQKGLTQEELAQALYVSRTAVSKWESGRGYPNIDTLKAIATFFCITVDQLLSSEELLTLAEEDTKQKASHLRDLVWGLLDISAVIFLFLPLFGQKADGAIRAVSLLSLTQIAPYLKIGYCIVVFAMVAVGIAALALQNIPKTLWLRNKSRLSVFFNSGGAILFVISQQPYAATVLLIFLAIKVITLIKKQ